MAPALKSLRLLIRQEGRVRDDGGRKGGSQVPPRSQQRTRK